MQELRGQKMQELAALKAAAAEAEQQLAQYADNDPVRFQQMSASILKRNSVREMGCRIVH